MAKKDNNLIIGIIIVGALILGLMYFGIIPGLFTISSYTEYPGSCSAALPEATYGAVGNQCYLLTSENTSQVMKVLSVQTITNSGGTVCRVDVTPASTGACLNNKVFISSGVMKDYCDSNENCQGTICSNNVCTDQQYVVCSSFEYSNWSICFADGQKTRTIISSSPAGCFGGNPILINNCTYVQQNCTSANWQANVGACTSNQQIVTYTKIGNCLGNKASITQVCVSQSTNQSINQSTNQTTTGTVNPVSSFLDKYLWYLVGGVILLIVFFLLKK